MKIVVSLALLLALSLGVWQLMEWRNLPPEVAFTKATRETISSSVSTNGKVDPSESAQARAEAAGSVDRILVKLRQNVNAGDPLVELNTGQLRQDLEAAEARIASVKSELAVIDAGGRQPDKVALQTQIDPLTVELKAAQEEYDKEVRLESRGGTTREQVTIRKNRVDALQAQIQGLRQRLTSLVAPTDRGPKEAQLRGEEAAKQQIQLRINQSVIRAPIAGTIYQFDLKPGAYLNPGDVVATIGRLSQVHVIVYIDEPDLGRVRPGLPVTITWDAMPGREWTGTVDRLPASIHPLDSRQVGDVTCVINNPDLDLLPGTNITARIKAETAENTITIPKEAVFRENGKTGVYVLAGDKLEWRNVTQGVNNVTRTEVKELKEGDAIALPSERTLAVGLQVRPTFPQ
ncbi:MAG: efflux RND transporter periplasmic adaptor subunit [Bryobacteraceae bacterium]